MNEPHDLRSPRDGSARAPAGVALQPSTRRAGAGSTSMLVVLLDALAPVEVADGDVLVVAPALNSRLRHWLSDDDAARRRAQERAAVFVGRLERRGVRAEGRVGDADPLQAIADALRVFRADAIVIAAGSQRTRRLADELVVRARARFAVPTSRAGASVEAAAGDRIAA
jgi:hypothetical protein